MDGSMIRHVDIEKDLPALLIMGRNMHKSSIFHVMEYSANKAVDLFNIASMSNEFCFFVSEEDGDTPILTGFFIGRAAEHFFTFDLYAIDLLFWVEPEYRGTQAGSGLVKAYRDWCEDSGVSLSMVGSSTGIDLDRTKRFYEKSGFQCVGHNFIGE